MCATTMMARDAPIQTSKGNVVDANERPLLGFGCFPFVLFGGIRGMITGQPVSAPHLPSMALSSRFRHSFSGYVSMHSVFLCR